MPALDGLRGVAVLAVLLYHLSPDLVPGGFLGVSLFFTLSGFLITNLLIAEWRSSGTIDLRRFWARRFRRLLPAALGGLVLVMAVAWLAADADQLRSLRGDVLSSLTYVANWRFIFNGDLYGAGYQEPSPVLHYWSLAIEEQFYIVVALVALGVARFSTRLRTWAIVFGMLAFASMLSTILLAGAPDTRIYFGSDTRAFELLAGVLLALAVGFEVPRWAGRRAVRHAAPLGALAVAAVACVLVATDQSWLYRGGLWAMAVVSVVLIVGAIDDGPTSRLLAWRPLMALGIISYGVYVYHWPIFLWLDADTTGLTGLPLAGLRLAVTLLLAVASFRWLEQPVRSGRLRWQPLAAAGMVAGAAVVVVGGSVMLDRQAEARAVVDETPALQLSASVAPTPLVDPPAPSPTEPPPPPPLRRVLFLGDSLVHQAWPTIEDRLRSAGVEGHVIGAEGEHLLTDGARWLGDLRTAIAQVDPDLVVLESCCAWGMPLRREFHTAPDGTPLEPDTEPAWHEWARVARELTDVARREGRAVLWLLSPPAQTNGYYGAIEGRIERANAIYQRIAECHPGVGLLDWRVIAAPDGSFTWDLPDATGTPVRVRHDDGLHFTREGQAVLAEFTRDALRSHWETAGGRRLPRPPACAP